MIGTKRIRLELALRLAKMAEDGGDNELAIELLRRAEGDTLVSANRILDIQMKMEGRGNAA